jgi:multidrug efflux pump subunit AcrA (membrane-fusion protein)
MLGDAAMRAVSVAQGVFLGPVAVHVELVGVLKDVLVAVGRLVGRDDALARLDSLRESHPCQRMNSTQVG